MSTNQIISKVWSFCNTLRPDDETLLEERINNSLQQAKALRQSILRKMFEGRLV